MPTFDSFDFFAEPAARSLLVLVPALLPARRGRAARRVLLGVAGAVPAVPDRPPAGALLPALLGRRLAACSAVVAAHRRTQRGGTAVLRRASIVRARPDGGLEALPGRLRRRLQLVDATASIRIGPDYAGRRSTSTAEIILPIGLSFATFRAADLLIKSIPRASSRALPPGRVLAYGLFPRCWWSARSPRTTRSPRPSSRTRAARRRRRCARRPLQILERPGQGVRARLPAAAGRRTCSTPSTSELGVAAVGRADRLRLVLLPELRRLLATSPSARRRLLGADLRPNFDWPYTQTNPTSFWNSWHMSLTRFCAAQRLRPVRRDAPQHAVPRHLRDDDGHRALARHLAGRSWLFGLYHAAGLIGHRLLVSHRRPRAPTRRSGSDVARGPALRVRDLQLPDARCDSCDLVQFYGRLFGSDDRAHRPWLPPVGASADRAAPGPDRRVGHSSVLCVVLPDRPRLAADVDKAARAIGSGPIPTRAPATRAVHAERERRRFKIAWIAGSEIQSIGDDHYSSCR